MKGKGKALAPQEKDEEYEGFTASEEQQIDEIVCHEEGVLLRNKKVIRDAKAWVRDPASDATHPDHLIHSTLSYRACATNNCRYH